jgi:hypothetical protein
MIFMFAEHAANFFSKADGSVLGEIYLTVSAVISR